MANINFQVHSLLCVLVDPFQMSSPTERLICYLTGQCAAFSMLLLSLHTHYGWASKLNSFALQQQEEIYFLFFFQDPDYYDVLGRGLQADIIVFLLCSFVIPLILQRNNDNGFENDRILCFVAFMPLRKHYLGCTEKKNIHDLIIDILTNTHSMTLFFTKYHV